MAAQRGHRAPRDASGTRGAMKAKTYVDRFVIKNADRGRTHWHAGGRDVGTELPHAAGALDRILLRKGRLGGVS
jgi:hypothetical protein